MRARPQSLSRPTIFAWQSIYPLGTPAAKTMRGHFPAILEALEAPAVLGHHAPAWPVQDSSRLGRCIRSRGTRPHLESRLTRECPPAFRAVGHHPFRTHSDNTRSVDRCQPGLGCRFDFHNQGTASCATKHEVDALITNSVLSTYEC